MTVYHAQVIRTDGTTETVNPANGFRWTAEELHRIVGGFFEIVALADGRMMVVNEEGKIHGLPLNTLATAMFNTPSRAWFDPIVGNVLVTPELYLLDEPADDDGDDDAADESR